MEGEQLTEDNRNVLMEGRKQEQLRLKTQLEVSRQRDDVAKTL
jgi:hypothetical protein